MKRIYYLIICLYITLLLSSNVFPFSDRDSDLCKKWATPIAQIKGLTNFYKVTNDFYRGAQPTSSGIKHLKKMGIKTIINLRSLHSDKAILEDTDINYFHISMKAWHPEEEDVIKFVKILADNKLKPIFVHCQHGADRTGLMSAMYRIIFCGWTKEQAIKEMIKGGFGFHNIWSDIIVFIRNADIEKIKTKAGIK